MNRSTAVAVIAAVLTAGCGSSEDPQTESPAPSTTGSTPAVETSPPTTLAAETSVPTTAPSTETADADTAAGEARTVPTDDRIEVELTAAESAAADSDLGRAVLEAFPAGFAPPTEAQGRCVSGKIVDSIGTERLDELGVTAETTELFGAGTFDEAEITTMVDVLFECVDVSRLIAGSFGPSVDGSALDCVAGYLDEPLLRDLATPFLSGATIDPTEFLARVQEANTACLDA